MKFALTIVGLLLPGIVQAQSVWEITGGTSSLFESSGAAITIHSPDQTLTTGFGSSPTGLHFGFSDSFKFHDYDMTAGDRMFSFNQLTLVERGLAVEKHFERNCAAKPASARWPGFAGCSHEKRITVFAGSVGASFATPYFSSYRLNSAGAGVLFQEMFSRGEVDTLESVHASKLTALQFGQWAPSIFRFSVDGGVLENIPRIEAQAQVRPTSFLLFAVGHNNIQITDQQKTEFIRYDSAQVAISIRRFQIYGSAFEGQARLSESAGVSIRLPYRFDMTAAYFNTTHQTRAWTETISKRFGDLEIDSTYSTSNGIRGFGFGGSLRTNRVKLSVTNQLMYDILHDQFVPTISGQVEFRINDTSVTLGILKPHRQRIEYTTYGNSFIQTFASVGPQRQSVDLGHKHTVAGVCQDEQSRPVSGCAVVVDHQEVFSDASGHWEAHVRHNSAELSVNVLEFAAPGEFECIECPTQVRPGESVTVVVVRK